MMPPARPRDLLVISSAPGQVQGDRLVLDKKFVEGMRRYQASWPGRVSCLLPRSDRADMPFADRFDPADLPFEVQLFPEARRLSEQDLAAGEVVLCSGDNANYLHLAGLCRKLGKAIHFTIEYIPETRRQIVLMDPGRSSLRKLKSLVWLQVQEVRRRRAFRQAAGLQANGYPAARHYRPVNPRTLLYLDNRIDATLLATPDEMQARRAHLLSGGAIRLVHSGRLEPMKGSQDLVAVARRLRDLGVAFTLEIFGRGSLEPRIRQEIAQHGLDDAVRLKGTVDFATELVPHARRHADIYLSCHRQSDPSCSYLENMGCGLAVAGYDNRMWAELAAQSGAGWVAPLGDSAALADRIAQAATDRETLAARCEAARDFAGAHLFEDEFAKRIVQLKGTEGGSLRDQAFP